ncbi:MAG: zf-HC2 domain-containing protein [Pyrinomonadaceae bacterium]
MSCDWTEKISLLIDGELGPEETAALQKHLRDCADCRSAQADFLLLRREIGSYESELDPIAQQQALQNIFASERAAQPDFTSLKNQRVAPSLPSLRERLFGGPRLSPALMAGFALLLIGTIVGLAVYLNSRRTTQSIAVSAPSGANTSENIATPRPQSSVSPRESVAVEKGNREMRVPSNNSVDGRINTPVALAADRKNERKRLLSVGRNGVERANDVARTAVRQSAPDESLAPAEPSYVAVSNTAPYVRVFDPAVSGTAQQRTTRHVEQAQVLLRSFRNTRLAARGPATDIAYDKKRSQKLLYQNIVLRREASKTGDVPVEKLLSSLEPILLDIANLPDRPARDDVRSIKERMQRKNIVAMLQVNSTGASRSY